MQREGYRDAKLRTLLDTLPEAPGPEGEGSQLRWAGPGGSEESSGAAILVSNNRYRLGHASARAPGRGSTRGRWGSWSPPRRAEPSLAERPWQEWTTPSFEVDAPGAIAAGIDGEAVTLEAPLRFQIRPAVLEVRIAAGHPGASPSAAMPEGAWETVRALARISLGRTSKPQHQQRKGH